MAVTVTPILAGVNTNVSDVIASADADVAAVVPHGLGVAPSIIILTNLLTVVSALAAWTATADATNVNCVKTAAVGSGNAGAQLRVTAMRPHSLNA